MPLPFVFVHGVLVRDLLLVATTALLLVLWRRHERRSRPTSAPASASVTRGIAAMARRTGIAGVTAAVLLHVIGLVALARADASGYNVHLAWHSNLSPIIVASAMPGTRSAAIAALSSARASHPREGDLLELDARMAVFEPRCDLDTWIDRGRFDVASQQAAPCHRTGDAALMLAEARFGDMADVEIDRLPTTYAKLRVRIARGEWRPAARLEEQLAIATSTRPDRYDAPAHHQCMAALFRHRAGEPAALERVQFQPDNETCLVVSALVQPAVPRGQALRALVAQRPDDPLAERLLSGAKYAPPHWPDHGSGASVRELVGTIWSCGMVNGPAQAAADGDGAPLAAELAGCPGLTFGDIRDLLRLVVPAVTEHREDLARALRYVQKDTVRGTRVLAAADDAALLRDVAGALGDTAEAAMWARIFDRYATVLADEDKLVAFLLI